MTHQQLPTIFPAFCAWIILSLNGWAHAGDEIGTVEDFSNYRPGPLGKGFVDDWRWSETDRKRYRQYSGIQIHETNGDQHLDVMTAKDLPFPRGYHRVVSFSPHFPPEADAIRLRIKVEKGVARIFLGGPTAYYANSDVFTGVKTIEAEDPPVWQDVEFSLNHPLWRNFRRAGFSTDAPRIYYNRWAQERTSLYIARGTAGRFSLDDVKLVSKGEGKPFPDFSKDRIELIRTIADFEDGNLEDAFTIYMADSESEWFEASWKRERPLRFAPTVFSISDNAFAGKKALRCVGRSAEEVHCAGVHTTGSGEANALQFVIKNQAPARRNHCIGMGPVEPFDILVFVAPEGKSFPWKKFEAPVEWKADGHRGFSFQLSYREIRNLDDLDFAIYQARRFLKSGTWTTLTIPLADFACIYGTGTGRESFLNQETLRGSEVIAIAWMHPWSRVGDRNADVTTEIDTLSFVRVSGTPAGQLRSYWQIPRMDQIRQISTGTGASSRLKMLLPGEAINFP